MEWVASTLHITSEHSVSSITTGDARISAASSRLNWCPCRIKWTRPLSRKTKSGFCACAITLQTQYTKSLLGPHILLSTLFSNTLNLRSSLNVSAQVPHPQKTTGKIIILIISYVAKNFIKAGKLRCTGFTSDSTAYLNGMQSSPCTATNLFSLKATCAYCQTAYQGTDTNGYCSSLLSPNV